MSCLLDPDPDQVALGGLHPRVSSVQLSRTHWPTAFLPGKARRSRPLRWHFCRVALSGLRRRPAPTAGLVKVRLWARRLGPSVYSASLRWILTFF